MRTKRDKSTENRLRSSASLNSTSLKTTSINSLAAILSFSLALGLSLSVSAAAINVDESSETQLTLYQQGMALVERDFVLDANTEDEIRVLGLTQHLMPNTLLTTGLDARERVWDAQRMQFSSLLRSVLGTELAFEHVETLERFEGQLIGIEPGQMKVLRNGSIKQLPLNGPWQPLIPAPSELYPTELKLSGLSYETPSFQLAYLTQNLGWSAHYSIQLVDRDRIRLEADAQLRNDTEVSFENVAIDLLAGKPNINQPQAAPRIMEMAMAVADAAPASVEPIQGYHLFSLPERLSLESGQSKYVPLIDAQEIPAQLSYRFSHSVYGGLRPHSEKGQAGQWLEFTVPEGIADSPLPEGEAQLYRRDSNGTLRFVGGERLVGTSPGQRVELNFGDAFDLRVERRQVDYQRTGNTLQQSYEVRIENGAEEARTLEYALNFNQPWTMIDATQLATADGMQARWLIEIPGRSELKLNYTVQLDRP